MRGILARWNSLTFVMVVNLMACSADESSGASARNAGVAPAGSIGNASGSGPSVGVGGTGIVDTGSAQPLIPQSSAPADAAGPAQGMGTAAPAAMVALDTCGADNPAGLSEEQVKALMAGGDAGGMRWLYPYDGTVFPRGMLAPTLMWDGADGSAVYVHIRSKTVDYKGCLKTTGPMQLELPQDVWQYVGDHSGGPSDPFTLELTVQGASAAIGPLSEQFIIAQATLKGSIYYNSYSGIGAIYRIPPGGTAQPFLAGTGCYGCHTVSANGQRLNTSTGGGPGGSFEITPMTQANPPMLAVAPGAAFSGLSPDGTIYIETAHPAGAVRPQGTPMDMALVNDAALYVTDTGARIEGSEIPPGAMMPIFSPDSRLIAFNDYGESQGRGLTVMDFDLAARKASNPRVVFVDPTTLYPGWPFFLPDNQAVVFALGVNTLFSGGGAGVFPGFPFAGPASDLFIVDLASGTATMLLQAMGLRDPQDAEGYLPFGPEELHQHYYPTVSPVAAGGYFWVFFDSIRHYGNKGIARQLWGSAIRIAADGGYQSDPSSPAFYVTGQDLNTGNHRAFTALDACKMDGDTCTTGTDCCGGFCFVPEGPEEFEIELEGKCTSEVPQCAKRSERCVQPKDCCETTHMCVAGFCEPVIGPD